jgi:hypothetical protein
MADAAWSPDDSSFRLPLPVSDPKPVTRHFSLARMALRATHRVRSIDFGGRSRRPLFAHTFGPAGGDFRSLFNLGRVYRSLGCDIR